MNDKNICEICKKKSNFNGYVWLSDGKYTDLWLCRSHYLKWCRSKDCKDIEKKYKKAKPTTKEWHKKYQTLQKAFDLWFEEKKRLFGEKMSRDRISDGYIKAFRTGFKVGRGFMSKKKFLEIIETEFILTKKQKEMILE